MKLAATTASIFTVQPTLPVIGPWVQAPARRLNIRPLAFGGAQSALERSDAFARRQEAACAAILALSLVYTLVQCLTQLS